MRVLLILLAFGALMCSERAKAQEEVVFSGPQPGEPIQEFRVKPLLDADAEAFELPTSAPAHALIFIHEVTRPSIGVMRTIAGYADSLGDKISCQVIFLTDDINETQRWAQVARQALPKTVGLSVSPEGREGPGALGLNRNVAMTVVIAKNREVVANFALVQPGDAVDSPRVAEAIAAAVGVPAPDSEALAAFSGRSAPMRGESNQDVDLRPLLAPVIRRDATQENIDAAAAKVEAEAETNPAFRRRLGDACRTIVDSGKLENYGNEFSQAWLKKWSEKYREQSPP